MMLRNNLRTDAQICGKSASQASLFVRHGRGVNRVYCIAESGHKVGTLRVAVYGDSRIPIFRLFASAVFFRHMYVYDFAFV